MEMKSAASLHVIGPCLLLLLLAALCQAASPSHSDNRIPNPHPLITTTTTTTSPTTATTATTRSSSSLAEAVKRPRRRGGRRCKCLKRMRQEVNELIADRLEDFETRYLRPLQRNHAQTLAPERTLLKGHLQTMDRRLQKVSGEVFLMKESLTTMEQQLRVVRQDLRTTGGDVQSLNESWHRLDGAVKDLSRFVSAVENVVLPAVSSPEQCPTGGCQATDPPLPQTYPRSCDEVYRQGGMQFQGDYYIIIKPDGVTHPFKALCKSFNNSGWTVIQRRLDGSVDFFRDWADYKTGFGSLEGEFWLGNDNIHYLTSQEPSMLRIEMKDWDDREFHAMYNSFRVDDEKAFYRLHVAGYHGNSGDSLRSRWENHDGMLFSTKDRDNDGRYYDSCAAHYHGAWWFNNCFDSHLNGKYYHKGFHQNYFQRDGIQWNAIHMYSSLQSVHMMLRPAPPTLQPLSDLDPDLDEDIEVKDGHKGEGRRRAKVAASRGKGGKSEGGGGGGFRGEYRKVEQEV